MMLRWMRLRVKEDVSKVETVMPDTVTSNDEVLAEGTDNRGTFLSLKELGKNVG